MELNLGFKDDDGYESTTFMGESALIEKLICISSIAYVSKCDYHIRIFGAKYSDNYYINKKDIKKALKMIRKNHINNDIHDTKYFLENNEHSNIEVISEIKNIFLKYHISFFDDVKTLQKNFFHYDGFTLLGSYNEHCVYGDICISPQYFENTFYDSFQKFKKIYNMSVIESISQQLSNVCKKFNYQIHGDAEIHFETYSKCCSCRIFSYSNLHEFEKVSFESYNMENIEDYNTLIVIHSAILNRLLSIINFPQNNGWKLSRFEKNYSYVELLSSILNYNEPQKRKKLNSWI